MDNLFYKPFGIRASKKNRSLATDELLLSTVASFLLDMHEEQIVGKIVLLSKRTCFVFEKPISM